MIRHKKRSIRNSWGPPEQQWIKYHDKQCESQQNSLYWQEPPVQVAFSGLPSLENFYGMFWKIPLIFLELPYLLFRKPSIRSYCFFFIFLLIDAIQRRWAAMKMMPEKDRAASVSPGRLSHQLPMATKTEEDNKRYENQKIRRALHFSCIGGIQRLRHLIIYSHLKKNTIADTCSEECIGEDCPQAYPAEENGRQQQQ